jgi:hypothetical protein
LFRRRDLLHQVLSRLLDTVGILEIKEDDPCREVEWYRLVALADLNRRPSGMADRQLVEDVRVLSSQISDRQICVSEAVHHV